MSANNFCEFFVSNDRQKAGLLPNFLQTGKLTVFAVYQLYCQRYQTNIFTTSPVI